MKRITLGLTSILLTLSVIAQLHANELNSIISYLTDLEQEHLLQGLNELSVEEQERFYFQVKQYDKALLQHQQAMLSPDSTENRSVEPIQADRSGSKKDRVLGEKLIREGKAGCLILAGGQGSRLGFNGPKGIIGVSPIKGKSLFQLFAERTLAASARASRPLHLAIMTSPLNHAQTTQFFEENSYFGLIPSQLHFFKQSVLPFCDDAGNWLLERPGILLEGPDGNGRALHVFYRSGTYGRLRAKGVDYISVIPIDNPLADPFDAELIGFNARTQAEVVLKTIARTSIEEKVGVVARENNAIKVVEYSEVKGGDMTALNTNGTPLFGIASISLFSFHMDFIERIATDPQCSLPLHLARKQTSVVRNNSIGKIQAWKYETFIFDVLPFARRVEILIYPREICFSPLKNAQGSDSLQTVQEALLAFDRHVYENLSGLPAPSTPFELHPAFYYPTPEMIKKWKGKQLPNASYIER